MARLVHFPADETRLPFFHLSNKKSISFYIFYRIGARGDYFQSLVIQLTRRAVVNLIQVPLLLVLL